jgi:hypothetical protein
LIEFNAANYVPQQAVINHATLQIFLFATGGGPTSPMGSDARQLQTGWDEDLVTWNSHQPAWGGVVRHSDIPWVLGWHYADVTDLVREWVSPGHPNNGVIIIGDERIQERELKFTSINANNNQYPRLVVDYTVSTDTTPPTSSVQPLPTYSQSSFDVSWDGTAAGGSGIAHFDVQYLESGGTWTDWLIGTAARSSRFYGGRMADLSLPLPGCETTPAMCEPSGMPRHKPAWMLSRPPPPSCPCPDYLGPTSGSSGGEDNPGGSGIDYYDVQVRFGAGTWEDWLRGTRQVRAEFTGAEDDGLYGFRVRAVDRVGNVQPYPSYAQAQTNVEASGPVSFVKPFRPSIICDDSFLVEWTGTTAPDLSIDYFDVRYRFGQGTWISWLTNTKLTSAVFSDLNPQDGPYYFEVRAMDSAGRLEPFTAQPEASTNIDCNPPFMVPQAWLPVVNREYYP